MADQQRCKSHGWGMVTHPMHVFPGPVFLDNFFYGWGFLWDGRTMPSHTALGESDVATLKLFHEDTFESKIACFVFCFFLFFPCKFLSTSREGFRPENILEPILHAIFSRDQTFCHWFHFGFFLSPHCPFLRINSWPWGGVPPGS